MEHILPIRVLPDDLINQIAAGEVVERPASVVKELIENALDAGADQIVIDVADGGRTLINIIDNGGGMSREDLARCIMRHATSKLDTGDLLNITTMGFRGEALPSIASVSDMTIDTRKAKDGASGLSLNCSTGEIKPSAWESGTRVRVENLFSKTPARLKFLRSDRAEMMGIVDAVKRLALSRPNVGFILNNKWRFPKGQPMAERIVAIMGDDVQGRMIELRYSDMVFGIRSVSQNRIPNPNTEYRLFGFISEPTLRRAGSVDQYLFVNGRPVKDKVLVGALRAAYADVMSTREFPLCALYLELPPREVDVNVSPAKTEVHFLEPARIRSFIIRTLRDALAVPLARQVEERIVQNAGEIAQHLKSSFLFTAPSAGESVATHSVREPVKNYDLSNSVPNTECRIPNTGQGPLGRVIGQIGNKYIIAENHAGLVVVDQHAAHERITYERLRSREINRQPLLVPLVVKLKPEEVAAVIEVAEELTNSGLKLDVFGEDAIAIYEKPADWDLDWAAMLRDIAAEVRATGHSSKLSEKLHLKLAGHACHHSVRAGQRLDMAQMDALLRDIEATERAGQCNHGRPVYKVIPFRELDGWFER